MTIQHLRSSTANKRPTPAAMSDGQLAVNTNTASPGLFFKDSAGALIKVGPVHVGTTAPNASPAGGGEAGNTVGEQWLDTTGGTYVFKTWDGSAWRSESGTFVDVNGDVMTGALVMDNQQQVRFRETTANGTNFIAIQAPASVSADRTLTLPDVTGTLVSTGDTGSVTSTMIADGTIVNADINASAAIAGTKISPDFGSQNVTTTGTSTSASFTPTSSAVPTNGVYLPAANSVAISTGGSGRLFVDASGRVGVGRTPVAYGSYNVLDLAGSAGTIQKWVHTGSSVELQAYASATLAAIGSATNHPFIVTTNDQERLRITSAGLVGIGTQSPDALLTVNGVGAFGAGAVTIPSIAATGDLNTGFWFPAADTIAASTGGSERARIDSSGRLLVGTSSYSGDGTMVARGSSAGAATQSFLVLQRGQTNPAPDLDLGVIRFTDAAGSLGAQIAAQSDGGFSWGTNDYPTRLVFSTTADGASSPTERLYLYSNGYVRAPGVYALTTAVAADVRVDSDGYLYRSTSSIRYKKDVETLKDEYADAILNARPVWFRSLSEKDNPDWGYWGFIAEEIEQIDPRLCTYSTNEDGEQQVESVQYDRFVPHLLNLIKRQQQAIETLEAKVAALESA